MFDEGNQRMHRGQGAEAPEESAPATSGRTIRYWARLYDAVSWLLSRGRGPAIRNRAIELAGVEPGQRVLDVGCGTGTLALALAAKVGVEGEACGIDASPEMIGVARRKAARRKVNVGLQVGLIEDISFPDNRFDRVLSTFMLHHLPDDLKRRGLAEIHRVTKPGGRLLIVDFASQNHSLAGHLLPGLFGRGAAHGGPALSDLLSEAGFTDIEQVETEYRQFAFTAAVAGA